MGALVYYFKSIVENSVGRPESLKRIITWKQICVANASIGLIIYGVRLALEIYQFCKNNELDKEIISVIIYCFLLVLKVIRILAFNSFSSWMRLKLASQGLQDVFLAWGSQSFNRPSGVRDTCEVYRLDALRVVYRLHCKPTCA